MEKPRNDEVGSELTLPECVEFTSEMDDTFVTLSCCLLHCCLGVENNCGVEIPND